MSGPASDVARAPAPPGRTPWWAVLLAAVGVVVVLVVITAGVLGTLSGITTRTGEGDHEAQGQVTTVLVTAPSAEVRIRAVEDAGARADWSVRSSLGIGRVVAETDDGVMSLRLECRSPSFATCSTTMDLTVPADADLVLRVDTGRVEGDGIAGTVTMRADAAAITLTGLRSQRVDLRTGVGAVAATFVRAPQEVAASTSLGAVVVRVPDDGGTYAITTDSGLDGSTIGIRTDPQSPRTLSLGTDIGHVTVEYTGADEQDRPSAARSAQ